MTEYRFDWLLERTCQENDRYISKYKINKEWKLVCFWSSQSDPYKPEYMEIRRTTEIGDVTVSGKISMRRNVQNLLRRNFTQLIEDGAASAIIGLKDVHGVEFVGTTYVIVGTLKITVQKEYSKGLNSCSLLKLSYDFESLLDTNGSIFSDVKLVCQSRSFPAHKNVLSVRSPVFGAMFSTQMEDNIKNRVMISDIKAHTLEIMLMYIYSGRTGDLSVDLAGEVLFAADKYQMTELKKICTKHLKTSMSNENVLKTLVLGYLHDIDLQNFAIDFICKTGLEFKVLENKSEWKNLVETRPSLAMEILISMVKYKEELLKKCSPRAVTPCEDYYDEMMSKQNM